MDDAGRKRPMDSPDGVEPDASSSAAERDGPADAKKPRIGASPAKELAGQDGARNGPEADQMSDVEVQKAPSDGTDLVSYQIAFRNVPRAAKEGDFMNACKAAGVDASSVAKVKKAKKWDYAFVTFASKEARDAAMEKLAGCQIKDQAVQMESLDDNWRRDREQQGDNRSKKGRRGMSGSKNKADPNDTRTPQERLADQVTPLWRIPYSEQLAEKTKVARDVLTDVGKQLSASAKVPDASVAHKTMVGWVEESQLSNDGLPCPLQEIVPSPSATNYRTKCEFSFGLDPSGKRTLGFLLGLFKDGLTAVLDASECLHVSKAALQIRAALQEYTENHEWPPYDRTAKEGVWRLVVVKSFSSSGENQVIVQINPTNLARERIEEEKRRLVAFIADKTAKNEVAVTSLMWQEWDGVFNGFVDKVPLESLIGDGYVHENLCGLKFRVSPLAFFQINTLATEKLYGLVADWCGLSEQKDTVLLDLCCGTGTIGLTMAKSAKKIIGVELSADAVKDAIVNAEANGLEQGKDVEYICSRVEDALSDVFKKVDPGQKVVAVLDPPREGVHPSVTKAIRNCADLKHVVFVSCNPVAATRNFVDLCRPTEYKFPGKPFRLTKAVPVDLFPQTKLVELVLMFERSE